MSLLLPASGIVEGALRGSPNIPKFNPVDAQQVQGKTIAGNVAATPGLENWAAGVNSFNQSQLQQMLAHSISNYSSLKDEASTNIDAMLKGELPKDVMDLVSRKAAASSLTGGFGGSEMGRNAGLRDLGLTSLDRMDKGVSSLEGWAKTMSALETPNLMDLSKMFISPEKGVDLAVNERNAKFARDYVKGQADWQGSLGYSAASDIQGTEAPVNSLIGNL